MSAKRAPAKNDYRQLRVTLTEESRGRWTIRGQVKPLEAQWDARQVVLYRQFQSDPPPSDLEAVFRLLASVMTEEADALAYEEEQQA